MRLIVEPDYERMSKWAANYMAKCSILPVRTKLIQNMICSI